MRFKYASGTAPGNPGVGQTTEHGDRIGAREDNGVSVFFLSEPPSSQDDPGIRTELTAEVAAALMVEHFDSLYLTDNENIRRALLNNVAEAFERKGAVFTGFGSSLLFVAVKDTRYLAGHLGGGLIARANPACSVLSQPQIGIFGSEAELSAEDLVMETMRIYKGVIEEPFGFLLLSDGACRSLYDDGTGTLSPACDTFVEWLRANEAETVSEALSDNIRKYFKNEAAGNISVAMLVSNDEPGTEKSEGKAGGAGKIGKHMKWLIAAGLILILAVVFVLMTQLPAPEGKRSDLLESNPPPTVEPVDYEPEVTFATPNPISYIAGTYQVGDDIPAGEYFFWTGEMMKADSVKINGETCLSGELYCMTVWVGNGDTLVTDNQFTAEENVNPVKAANGTLISGRYKIGKDIAPGEYAIRPADKNTPGRYYSVFDGEISNDTEISGDTMVTVPDQGYIVFYHSIMTVK
jgi:hypothetical protein